MSLNGIFQHTDLCNSLIACEEVVRHVLIYYHWRFNLLAFSVKKHHNVHHSSGITKYHEYFYHIFCYYVLRKGTEIKHSRNFRLYISENMVYPPSALWALDGRLHVPREWGGGGGAWNNNTCYKGEHLPFLKKFLKVHIAALLKPLPVSWTRSLSCRIIIMDSRIYFMIR